MFHLGSHGTFPHFSLQRSHLNICYYHQDLHFPKAQCPLTWRTSWLRERTPYSRTFLNREGFKVAVTSRSIAWAPSIFRAGSFGRWVVTLSLEGGDFHAHLPAVKMNQQRCCNLLSEHLGTLTQRPVHPASPVLLTKNGPLRVTCALIFLSAQLRSDKYLTYLKVWTPGPEMVLQIRQFCALPDKTAFTPAILRETSGGTSY